MEFPDSTSTLDQSSMLALGCAFFFGMAAARLCTGRLLRLGTSSGLRDRARMVAVSDFTLNPRFKPIGGPQQQNTISENKETKTL